MGEVKWEDITEMLTDKGKQLPTGKVLIFEYEGSKTALRIVRKSKGKVWAKEVQLFKPEEVDIVDK